VTLFDKKIFNLLYNLYNYNFYDEANLLINSIRKMAYTKLIDREPIYKVYRVFLSMLNLNPQQIVAVCSLPSLETEDKLLYPEIILKNKTKNVVLNEIRKWLDNYIYFLKDDFAAALNLYSDYELSQYEQYIKNVESLAELFDLFLNSLKAYDLFVDLEKSLAKLPKIFLEHIPWKGIEQIDVVSEILFQINDKVADMRNIIRSKLKQELSIEQFRDLQRIIINSIEELKTNIIKNNNFRIFVISNLTKLVTREEKEEIERKLDEKYEGLAEFRKEKEQFIRLLESARYQLLTTFLKVKSWNDWIQNDALSNKFLIDISPEIFEVLGRQKDIKKEVVEVDSTAIPDIDERVIEQLMKNLEVEPEKMSEEEIEKARDSLNKDISQMDEYDINSIIASTKALRKLEDNAKGRGILLKEDRRHESGLLISSRALGSELRKRFFYYQELRRDYANIQSRLSQIVGDADIEGEERKMAEDVAYKRWIEDLTRDINENMIALFKNIAEVRAEENLSEKVIKNKFEAVLLF